MIQVKTSIIEVYSKYLSISEVNQAIEDKIREFKSILVLKGVTQADIAFRIGVARSNVNAVIHGRSRSKYIEEALRMYGIEMKELYVLKLLKGAFHEQI